jgi:TRAP-type C4-dicarboxylate transport system permease large subunit
MVEAWLITPRIGTSVFIISGITGDVPMLYHSRGVIPFVVPMMGTVSILIASP